MRILEFVNSRDIRSFWEEIGYLPSALEAAWLIWQGKNQTVREKRDAWREMMAIAVDSAIPEGSFRVPQPSLMGFLGRYMMLEDELIAAFYKNEPDTAYAYRLYLDNADDRDWYDEPAVFRSFDEAYENAEDGGGSPRPAFIEFVKTYMGGEGKQLFVRFNAEKEIVRVDERNYLSDGKDYEIFQEVFRNMSFHLPTPFRAGDLVATVHGKYTRPSYWGGTFVVDSADRGVSGFEVDGDGVVYRVSVHDYMDAEYLRKPLAQEDKALYPISQYLKKDIGLETLLNEHRRVLLG